jgi:type IV secretion system protein VirB10
VNEASESPPASAPKVDPETLVLRGRPRRVVRFRRCAIIAIAATVSAALVGITSMALRPVTFRAVIGGEDRGDDAVKPPPDALANAPKTYGDVPQLGPPLPGDLGRPILAQQNAGTTAAQSSAMGVAAQTAEADRQRLEAERNAARESGVMMQFAGVARTSDQAVAAPASTVTDILASPLRPPLAPERDPNAQQRKADFPSTEDEQVDTKRQGLTAPISPYTLTAGTVIAASLITGLNSDLPGLVLAQVTENAYDSVTGQTLLVPQGSRLIGSYDSLVAFGQKRALVVWQRIVLPDGSSVQIDNVPASDTAGYAGLADKVDVHSWQLLKGIALSTLLGVGTQLSVGDEVSDLVRAIRESTQQNGARAGAQIVSRSLNVQPSITVRPGWPVRVVVQKDIVLRPWMGQVRQ